MDKKKIRAGITIGDFNGIGMEVIIKTYLDNRMLDFCTPVVYGSSKISSFYRKKLHIKDFTFNTITDANQMSHKKANLINLWDEEIFIEPGIPSKQAGQYAVRSLQKATEDLAHNKIDVLVTAPLNKKYAQSDNFKYPGQTEYLAAYAHEDHPMMMMISDVIKLGLLTTHLPVKDVSSNLTREILNLYLKNFEQTLKRDFTIIKPKIAVLGLNPHAGDNGLLGKEELEIIIPVIKELNKTGMVIMGPYSADGFFGSGIWKNFDSVLAMYHDQGLAPFKALSFENGVNFTAGLPIVRTSPDHGTAYDIAGKNLASEISMRNAIITACRIYKARIEYKELIA